MNIAPAKGLLAFLQQIPDPRGCQGRRHSLEAMLASIVCAILCGARRYQEITDWIHAQPPATWHAIGFTKRTPKMGGFRYLMIQLFDDSFEAAIDAWIERLMKDLPQQADEELEAVAIDGKSLRGTFTQHDRVVHLLATFDHRTGYVLSQNRVSSKTNEHKPAWRLLRCLVLEVRIISGDAMFCQRD